MDYSNRLKINATGYQPTNGEIKAEDLDNSYTYIAKNNTWFLKNSEVHLETNMGEIGGFFKGTIKVNKMHGVYFIDKYGFSKEVEEKEICNWSDFNIYDKNENLVKIVSYDYSNQAL